MTPKKPNRAITSREVITDTMKWVEFAPHHKTCARNNDSTCTCGRNELVDKLERWRNRNEI